MPAVTREEAARERARAVAQRSHRPSERRDRPDGRLAMRSPYRAAAAATPAFRAEFTVERVAGVSGDAPEVTLRGYASAYEQPYEMWDMFGPYDEVVSSRAFDDTLAAKPLVVFRFNHSGTAMATTSNGRLELEADALGLRDRAWINPKRSDVRDLITAIEDRDVTEQSFMFMIEDGEWSEDYSQFRINRANLDRGDVGPVTYGANPFTVIASRAGEFLSAIPDMPVLAAREAMKRLALRPDLVPAEALSATAATPVVEARSATTETPGELVERVGVSIRLALAQLEVDKEHQ